jgi:glycosyltransferase involved in cell wall biosynthesis
MSQNSRFEILGVLPGFIPSTIIDVVQPMLDLHRARKIRFSAVLDALPFVRRIQGKDLVIFCRNTEPAYRGYLDKVRLAGIPFIYDLDDNLFEINEESEVGRFHQNPERQAMLAEYVRAADLVRVYTPAVRSRCQTLNPNTVLVSAPLDWRLIRTPPRQGGTSRPVKIVYSTSRTDDQLWQIFWESVQKVIAAYGSHVEVYFWGSAPVQLAGEKGIRWIPMTRSYSRFLPAFSASGFDIGLAPLPDDAFHRSKTNNKFREYSACGIAGIYSRSDVYTGCVSDHQTGLLVDNDPDSWYRALVELIENDGLRTSIQNDARRYALEHYSQDEFNRTWFEQISILLVKHTTQPEPAPIPAVVEQAQPTAERPAQVSLAGFYRKYYHRLVTLSKDNPESLGSWFKRAVFNTLSLLKVNLFKRI